MLRSKLSRILVVVLITSFATNLAAQDNSQESKEIYYGIEYLGSVEADRNIDTYNVDMYYPIKAFNQLNLSVYAGATITSANGDITQLEGELDEGTFREVNYENSATGIGPGLLIDWKYPISQRLFLHVEGIGNLLFYNEKFPAGGNHFNFMWRAGPSVQYDFGSTAVGLGYHWLHVSNGRGKGPKNPTYDAEGAFLRFSSSF